MLTFEAAAAGYANLWSRMVIRPEKYRIAEGVAERLIANRARYEAVSQATGVPWYWIAITHQMESGANFKTHLHNGDPLTARTVHVPAGRPANGAPPFTWEESAIDALALKKLHLIETWSVPRMLYEFERYNGFGYVNRGVNSPYLWSYSDLYTRGKYVRDGVFDPNAVSSQCGAAVLLKLILAKTEAATPSVGPAEPKPAAPPTPAQPGRAPAGLIAAIVAIIIGFVKWLTSRK